MITLDSCTQGQRVKPRSTETALPVNKTRPITSRIYFDSAALDVCQCIYDGSLSVERTERRQPNLSNCYFGGLKNDRLVVSI